MNIYCVKIRQRRLKDFSKHSFHYFPFDRAYFIPKKKKNLARRLFRYSLVMEVTPALRTALYSIKLDRYRAINIERNDDELKWEDLEKPIGFLDRGSWVMAIPTYALNVPRGDGTESKKARLAYVLSYAVRSMHNTKVHLPRVVLHTPRKTIPLMCSVCTNIPQYYANGCSPGRTSCRLYQDMPQLSADNSHQEGIEKSINGAGEIE